MNAGAFVLRQLLVSAALVGSVMSSGGCGVFIEGDFDGIAYRPDFMAFGVADRHDILQRSGSLTAVRRADAAIKLTVLLSAADNEGIRDDWRRLSSARGLELKRNLALRDGLLLEDLPLADLLAGDTVSGVRDRAGSRGEFIAHVVQSYPDDESLVAEQGLGSLITVTIEPDTADVTPHGGSIALDIEVKRDRDVGQDGDVATGAVAVRVNIPLVLERLGEANLSLAAPVMRCAAAAGPGRAGVCRDVDADPYVDATGTVFD